MAQRWNGRVQLRQLLVRNAGDVCGDLQIDLAVRFDTREVRLIGNAAEAEAMSFRIRDEPAHGEQTGHVTLRLLRQLQAPEIGGLALRLVVRNGARNRSFTAVVRGNGEQPVPVELVMQELQVVERGTRGLDDVTTPVVPPVLLQAEARAGAGNELPEARGARARIRERLEGAFDHRQQSELRAACRELRAP